MNAIKRYILLPLAIVLMGGVVFWSCSDDYLEVAPTGALSPDLLTTEAGIENLLLGAYSQLGGRGNYFSGASNWANGSIQGGEANKGTNDGDFTDINDLVQYRLDPTSRIPLDRWRGLFEGVSRVNQVLGALAATEDPISTFTQDERNRIEGEARFLRAHYYFQLKISYDKAPLLRAEDLPSFLTPVEIVNAQTEVPATCDLYPAIEEDLRAGYESLLPETQVEAGRANKWAAGAYLGKVLLYQEKWSEAKSVFDDVIANGQTANGQKYALLDDYSQNFNAEFDNGAESVFAVQAAANTGTTNNANPDFVLNFPHNTGASGPGNCCGFFQPSFDVVNSFRTEDGLPLLDNSYNEDDNAVVNDFNIASDQPFTADDGPVDPRLDHSVGRRGIPYLGWGPHPGAAFIRDPGYAGPFSPKKFVYYADQEGSLSDGTSWTRGYASVNYQIIRFADVLLMAAEAEIELGNLDAGLALINQVRARAANDANVITNEDGTPAANYEISLYDGFDSQDAALDALYFERKLELSGEGHRFFDLRRWGLAESELNRIIENEQQYLPLAYSGAVFTTPEDLFYPIPQAEIDLQGPDILNPAPCN